MNHTDRGKHCSRGHELESKKGRVAKGSSNRGIGCQKFLSDLLFQNGSWGKKKKKKKKKKIAPQK